MKRVKKGSVTGGIQQVFTGRVDALHNAVHHFGKGGKTVYFSVSDSVLRQLLAIMKSYRAVYLDHSFQTLKMLEGLFTG